jgi:prophage regulatory protein
MLILVRIPDAFKRLRESRSGGYAKMANGLLPKPVKTGPRAAALPDDEVEAIVRARIAGKSDGEIRALVVRLEAARKAAADAA